MNANVTELPITTSVIEAEVFYHVWAVILLALAIEQVRRDHFPVNKASPSPILNATSPNSNSPSLKSRPNPSSPKVITEPVTPTGQTPGRFFASGPSSPTKRPADPKSASPDAPGLGSPVRVRAQTRAWTQAPPPSRAAASPLPRLLHKVHARELMFVVVSFSTLTSSTTTNSASCWPRCVCSASSSSCSRARATPGTPSTRFSTTSALCAATHRFATHASSAMTLPVV